MSTNETPETPAPTPETKAEKFTRDPDSFVDIDTIVMAVIRTENGYSTFHGAVKRVDMEIAISRLQYKTFQIMFNMDLANEMKKKESEIVTIGKHNGAPLMKKIFNR